MNSSAISVSCLRKAYQDKKTVLDGVDLEAQAGRGFRLDEVASGVIVAQTASGRVAIGVHDGVAAYLDVDTKFGAVRNDLDDAGRHGPDARTVEVHARTSFGDVVVRRSSATYTLREEE